MYKFMLIAALAATPAASAFAQSDSGQDFGRDAGPGYAQPTASAASVPSRASGTTA